VIITGIKIENFVGFKKGINKDIIELKDLPSGIIPISGQNGSGKTTLIQSLSIFSDNKDFLTAYQICNLITSGYAELVTYYNLDTHKSKKPIFNEFKKHLDLQLKNIEAKVKN
jgi:AAA15 family ATPase/GTPase